MRDRFLGYRRGAELVTDVPEPPDGTRVVRAEVRGDFVELTVIVRDDTRAQLLDPAHPAERWFEGHIADDVGYSWPSQLQHATAVHLVSSTAISVPVRRS